MELYKYRKVCKAWSELITVVLIDKLTSMITRIKVNKKKSSLLPNLFIYYIIINFILYKF
jgi:hypothetical protein